ADSDYTREAAAYKELQDSGLLCTPKYYAQRTKIMREVMHAEAAIFHPGVAHLDLSPRNIIIKGGYKNPLLTVVIIDFNVSQVLRLGDCRNDWYLRVQKLLQRCPGKMLSPAQRFWAEFMSEFTGPGWVSQKDGRSKQWLWKYMRNTKRYIPM
ncbi:hypothetical protein K458DRAFT_286272, partial [Lentithecium fluviatile CBS 122367]